MREHDHMATISANGVSTDSIRKQRRVIVFADLVESVRLMQHDEAGAIDRWRRFAAEVRGQLLPALGGRLVRTAGDGLLIECEHTQPAVALSLALHDAVAKYNQGLIEQQKMYLRIGVHVSDVLFDEHEAYGAGVNLSQRLSSLAQPGGTVVSLEVRDTFTDGVQASFHDLGLRYIKHVAEPIRAFAVSAAQGTGGGGAAAMQGDREDLRPIVAVVPFRAMPADAEHDALGHAMADDIIATLSRHPELRVLSRLSTAAVRDSDIGLPRLRELLGAAFVLSGRFYVRGQRIRLAAELCELRDGQVLWTGTHHADVQALFDGQDDLVPQLVAQITQQVQAHELTRARSLPMSSLASYSLFLGASGLINSLVPRDFNRAHELLDHLAERHPRQAMLQAMLSNWHFLQALQGWSTDSNKTAHLVDNHAQRALDLDPSLADALVTAGVAQQLINQDYEAAQALFNQALAADPQHPMAWARLSETQRRGGDATAAKVSAERALSLSPLDPQLFIFESFAASAALEGHRYADAQRHARAALRQHALFRPPHLVLICALWLDGEEDAARSAAQECLRCVPAVRVRARRPGDGGVDSPYTQALLAAGLPR
jgi:adenylate cyclase